MNNPDTKSGVPTAGPNAATYQPPASPTPQAAQVKLDDSETTASYANFCQLTGTPEELIVDFGLNPQLTSVSIQPVVVTQRIVTGWHTAKRVLRVLQQTVERHEAAFGVLETDVQKRVRRA